MPLASGGNIITSSDSIAAGVIQASDIAAGAITNTEINASAAIADTKLGTISTAGKVDGAALTGLANIPAGAGQIPSANVGSAWQRLGTTVLGSNAATISVSNFSARKILRVVMHCPGRSAGGSPRITFNSDTGTNYGATTMADGGARVNVSAAANIALAGDNSVTNAFYMVMDIDNDITSVRKFAHWNIMSASDTGSSTPDNVWEGYGVWNNTSAQITTITFDLTANNYLSGTRVTVFGSQD